MCGLLAAQELSVDSGTKGELNKNSSDGSQPSSTFIYVSENTTIVNFSEVKNATVVIVDKKEISQSSRPSKNILKKKEANVLLPKKTLSKEVEERLKKNIPIASQVGNGNNAFLFVYNEFGNKVFSIPSGSNKDLKCKGFAIARPLFHNYLVYEHIGPLVKELKEFVYSVPGGDYFSRPPPEISA